MHGNIFGVDLGRLAASEVWGGGGGLARYEYRGRKVNRDLGSWGLAGWDFWMENLFASHNEAKRNILAAVA
jgi:hypothetical protein